MSGSKDTSISTFVPDIQVSPIDADIRNICKGLDISRDQLITIPVTNVILRTYKHAIIHRLKCVCGYTAKDVAAALGCDIRDINNAVSLVKEHDGSNNILNDTMTALDTIPIYRHTTTIQVSTALLDTVNTYFKSNYADWQNFIANIIFDNICRYDILRFTHKEGFYSCDRTVLAQINSNQNIIYDREIIELIWQIFYS